MRLCITQVFYPFGVTLDRGKGKESSSWIILQHLYPLNSANNGKKELGGGCRLC